MRLPETRFEDWLEKVLVPPVAPIDDDSDTEGPRVDDFRRVVAIVAIAAVGFFAPSLLIAKVPQEQWLPFLFAAGLTGLIVGGSFVLIPHGSRWSVPAAVLNVVLIAWLAVLFGSYYHQLGLLYTLIVASHAVVHGVYAGLTGALAGSLLVSAFIAPGQQANATDPVYALIYLTGAALVPWTAGRLAHRRAAAVREQLTMITATEREAVMILARAAEAKDHVTGDHVVRVGDLAAELGRRAGLSDTQAEDVRFAGMLHDVGKLHLPDSLLTKAGPLTPDEWELMKKHTIWGERILGSSDGFALARRIARSHHENFDGTGYPDGLRGGAIPLEARIVKVADVFDALLNERPYKEAWDLQRCLDEIVGGAGTRYDPELARELVQMFRSLPEPVVEHLVRQRAVRTSHWSPRGI